MHPCYARKEQPTRRPVLRSVKEPPLITVVSYDNCVPYDDALSLAEQSDRIIPSNKRMSRALVGSNEWRLFKGIFPCCTGTLVAYENPGETFSDVVKFIDPGSGLRWIFPVPYEHRRKRDCALATEQPEFMLLKEGRDRIVVAAQVGLIERFPPDDGWYIGDQRYGIPQGEHSRETNPDASYLFRKPRLIGPVVRSFCGMGDPDDLRDVILDNWPSRGFGVAFECDRHNCAEAATRNMSLYARAC